MRLYVIVLSVIFLVSCGESQEGDSSSDYFGDGYEAPEIQDEKPVEDPPQEIQELEKPDVEPEEVDPLAGITSCEGTTLFTHPPVEIDQIEDIIPLGNLGTGNHLFPTDHIYIVVNDWQSGEEAPEVPVYAPGNIIITRIVRSTYPATGNVDYAIDFYPCREVMGSYMHINHLVESILEDVDLSNCSTSYPVAEGASVVERCFSPLTWIEVLAGAEMGSVTKGIFDFTLFDIRESVDFINEEYSPYIPGKRNTVCPVDYYFEDLKNEMGTKFGEWGGSVLRTVPPLCGSIFYDIPGTASGLWFHPDYPIEEEHYHLALAPDNIDPTYSIIGAGVLINETVIKHYYRPENSGLVNRALEEITSDGNVYCFETSIQRGGEVDDVFMIHMPTETTLRIEEFPELTSCDPLPSFAGNVVTFER